MPGILTTVVGANIKPFVNDMRAAENVARATGQRIRVNLAAANARMSIPSIKPTDFRVGNTAGAGNWFTAVGNAASGAAGKVRGLSTVMRELLVIAREIGRGNWARVPGSLTVMAQAAEGAVTALGAVLSVIGGIIVATAVWYKRTQMLAKELAGIKLPNWNPEYIPKHLQAINQIAEGWRQIAVEAQKALDKYNDAASVAERIKEATDAQFSHVQKMNEYAKSAELEHAGKNPEKRLAVEAKYEAIELQRKQDERNAELANMNHEQYNLQREGERKMSEMERVSSKKEDENLVSHAKANYDAAQKYLDDEASPNANISMIAQREFILGLSQRGATKEALDEARRDAHKAAAGYKQAYHDAVENESNNDIIRARNEDRQTAATAAFSRATTLGGQIDDKTKEFAKQNGYDFDEAIAKLQAENAKRPELMRGSVNSLQRVGAYASPAETALIDVNKRMEMELKIIASILRNPPPGRIPFGGAQH